MNKDFGSKDSAHARVESIACDRARLEASAWCDGEAVASRALEAHLENCAACRRHVEALREWSARLLPLRYAEPVADLWPLIRARTQTSQASPANWSLGIRRIAAALIGCAGTAALLEAASSMEHGAARAPVASHEQWPAALHEQGSTALELRDSPEQRLLASLDPMTGGKR